MGLLFLSGRLVEHASEIASGLAEGLPGSADGPPPSWLIGAGAGVLTERGELERQSAAAGLVLPGVRATGVASGPRLETFAQSLGDALRDQPSASALVLVRSDAFEEDLLEGLGRGHHRGPGGRSVAGRVFGGGTLPERDVLLVRSGVVDRGPGAALLLGGLGPARITAAPACRLLGPWRTVSSTRGSMLLEIEGERALDVLSSSAEGLPDQPLVLLAIASGEAPTGEAAPAAQTHPLLGPAGLGRPGPSHPQVLLRAIQGVDPSRGGVLVREGLRAGARVAFAVRDGSVARATLTERLGALSRATGGSAPRFGIYVNCAGRGAGLYGAADVDTKLIRARFGDIPLVGLQTAFELAPFEDATALQLYTGVLALFCAPS